MPEGAVARLGTVRLRQSDSDQVSSIAFSPDGKILAGAGSMREWYGGVGEEPYRIRLWDTRSGKEIRRFGGGRIAVPHLAFSPDGKSLVSSGEFTQLWDIATGSKIRDYTTSTAAAVFSPDGKTLAAVFNRKSLRIWDLVTGKTIREIEKEGVHEESVAYSPVHLYQCQRVHYSADEQRNLQRVASDREHTA